MRHPAVKLDPIPSNRKKKLCQYILMIYQYPGGNPQFFVKRFFEHFLDILWRIDRTRYKMAIECSKNRRFPPGIGAIIIHILNVRIGHK